MKIYDCFTFYNELDLLEIRLREHYDHVDHFVIGEANMTFTGKPKPYYLLDNWERFQPWADKIIRVEITDLDPSGKDAWANEAQSRENLLRGFADHAGDEDIILLSDCDEIFRGETLQQMKLANRAAYGFRMPCFYFKLNYMQVKPTLWWEGGCATRKSIIMHNHSVIEQNRTPGSFGIMETLRRSRHVIGTQDGSVIAHAGWHFGWLGDETKAKEKIQSFAHQELNNAETLQNIDLELSIKLGLGLNPNDANSGEHHVVMINEYFPRCIEVDKSRWAKYIIPNATKNALDYLKI